MENTFQECVLEARDRGVTVLFVGAHILAETEALCGR